VLVVLHEPDLLGASRSVLRVVPFLEELGWEFAFWTPAPGEAQAELDRAGRPWAGEPRLLRYGWGPLRAPPGAAARMRSVPGYLRRFGRWTRAQSPALVHANTLITIPEAVVARRTGSAVLMHVHEVLGSGRRSAVAAWCVRRTAHMVVAPSRAAAAALRSAGLEAGVVPNGVPLPASVRRRDGGGRLVIGTVGTICRGKGSDAFVAAAEQVRRALPDAEFRMIGAPAAEPERSWAQALIASARAGGVRWGTTDDVFAELRDWDLFVLPSRQDAFPLAVLEAMASGLPVVASRVGGIPEQVTPETGVLVEPGDGDALAAAIVELARQPDRLSAMGAAARARVEDGLSLERQAARLDEIYRATLEVAAHSARAPAQGEVQAARDHG
jgi:glycosyltransferase involved in cell wall biosynthesis